MRQAANAIVFLILIGCLAVGANAQAKKTKRITKQKPSATSPHPTPEEPPIETPAKRNERPNSGNAGNQTSANAYAPVYFYEFTRPGFPYEHVLIDHDEAGKGKISFSKSGSDELITDPIQLSTVTMGNLLTAFTALNFLDSTENYQTSRDYSNMGNVSITMKKNGKERAAKYNWSDNKQAKFLMDEYRRIANEYTWKFEIGLARQNQPLQAPTLMATLDNYVRQNEISDPPHLIEFLTALSTDERLPLIARDHAARIVKQLEKVKRSAHARIPSVASLSLSVGLPHELGDVENVMKAGEDCESGDGRVNGRQIEAF